MMLKKLCTLHNDSLRGSSKWQSLLYNNISIELTKSLVGIYNSQMYLLGPGQILI